MASPADSLSPKLLHQRRARRNLEFDFACIKKGASFFLAYFLIIQSKFVYEGIVLFVYLLYISLGNKIKKSEGSTEFSFPNLSLNCPNLEP